MYCVKRLRIFGMVQLLAPYRVLTCMVHVRSSVEGGGAAGLDLPPRASVLWCPTAEGRVIGPAKVTGKPQKSCKCVEERSRPCPRGDHISSSSFLPTEKFPRTLGFNWTMTRGPVMIWLQATLWSFIHSSWSATSTRGQQRTAGHELWVPQQCEIEKSQLRREKLTGIEGKLWL